MFKYKFLDIFQEKPDGSIYPKQPIEVNGLIFNSDTVANPDVTLGAVNFHLYKYLDIAAEKKDGILVIKGFYKK